MQDPYLLLGMSPSATDDEIHQAYLEGVRRYPPDKDAQRFQALHRAYETIKTPKRRLQYALFDTELPTPDALFERLCPSDNRGRVPVELFTAVLRAGASKENNTENEQRE